MSSSHRVGGTGSGVFNLRQLMVETMIEMHRGAKLVNKDKLYEVMANRVD